MLSSLWILRSSAVPVGLRQLAHSNSSESELKLTPADTKRLSRPLPPLTVDVDCLGWGPLGWHPLLMGAGCNALIGLI